MERSGRVLDSRPKCLGLEPHRGHCAVSLSKNINPSLVLVQPRKTRPYITERLLMGCKKSNKPTNEKLDNFKKVFDFSPSYCLLQINTLTNYSPNISKNIISRSLILCQLMEDL